MNGENGGSTSIIIGLVIVLLVTVGGVWFWQSRVSASPSQTATPVVGDQMQTGNSTVVSSTGTQIPASQTSMSATVTYTDQGFSPSSVTIGQGGTVTFINQSSNQMWVASNPHPIHSGYSGTTMSQHCPDTAGIAFDQCSTGNTYTFTFQKIGNWGYHNHAQHSDTGAVQVVAE